MKTREMSYAEWSILERLLSDYMVASELEIFRNVKVVTMLDGQMGSFALVGAADGPKKLKAEFVGKDIDGADLLVSLFVDSNGRPAEVDIWRADFLPTISLPRPESLVRAA